jgi:hypothetical protein
MKRGDDPHPESNSCWRNSLDMNPAGNGTSKALEFSHPRRVSASGRQDKELLLFHDIQSLQPICDRRSLTLPSEPCRVGS